MDCFLAPVCWIDAESTFLLKDISNLGSILLQYNKHLSSKECIMLSSSLFILPNIQINWFFTHSFTRFYKESIFCFLLYSILFKMCIGKHTQMSLICQNYNIYSCYLKTYFSSEGTTCSSTGRNHALAGCSPVR